MRDLVLQYLTQRLSRRGFLQRLSRWGLTASAAASVADALEPLLSAPAVATDAIGVPMEGTGGELLVAQLHAGGVDLVFNCNSSGTSPIFDALLDHRDMHVIQVPHEGQAVAMAQGYTLASGKTGFALSGGVGFPNTLNNMYNAWKDRTPLLIAAQREASTRQHGGEGFGEWEDYLGPSASFTRWRWNVDRADHIPEITRRALTVAAASPGGPVALAFPSDMLAARGVKATVMPRGTFLRAPTVAPAAGQIEEVAKRLLTARQPLLVVGSEVTRSGAQHEVIALAERLSLPVAQGERLFADFPTNHPLYVGEYRRATSYGPPIDLIVVLGARVRAFDDDVGAHQLIQISLDADAIDQTAASDLRLVANVKQAAADLLAALESAATPERLTTMANARFEPIRVYTEGIRARRGIRTGARWKSTPLSWDRMGAELDALLDRDAIIVPELAELSWLDLEENAALSQLTFGPDAKMRIGRTTGSALGWGIGAAIGVKLAQPNRQVVALQGDGGFLFGQAESLWTMVRHEVPLIVVIFNNRSYNGPRNKVLYSNGRQAEAQREMTAYLGNPDVDFVRVAAGFGVTGELIRTPQQIRPALHRAIDSTREGRPYLIEALVERTGIGSESTWYPRYSVAERRTRKV